MRSELLFALVLLAGCPEEKTETPAPSRFAGVKKSARSDKASEVFCERSFSPGERAFVAPPEQPVPGDPGAAPKLPQGWRWVNLWASWCGPCLAEMPLLKKWKQTFDQDGVPLSFELWSVDEDGDAFTKALVDRDRFPAGQIHWLKSDGELPKLLESLGVDKGSAIPVHALVDPKGDLRCVRVGAVGENDYGTIKAIIGS